MVDEMNEMDCGLKEIKWNMINKFVLKEMRWNMSNEVDNVTSPHLSLTTLQVGQK